jgi:hypothetical protein
LVILLEDVLALLRNVTIVPLWFPYSLAPPVLGSSRSSSCQSRGSPVANSGSTMYCGSLQSLSSLSPLVPLVSTYVSTNF